VATPATLFPVTQSDVCPVKLLPLTDDWQALHDKITSMTPVGNTNTTIGLAWAWQALTAGEPMSAPAMAADTHQIILFLTDGDNTQNRWTTSQTSIDARMKLACQNVKNSNIKLYTILVIEGNETMLKECATDPSMFYKLTDANQLISVFESIGTELANLHLSR
jgi:hypothetical protein